MKRHFLLWENPRDAILTIVIILMVIGCINVYSASFVRAEAMMDDGRYFLKRYLMWAALGSACMYIIGFKFDYRRFLTPRFCGLTVLLGVLLLVCVMTVGDVINGARRWLHFGPVSLQPSELAKAIEVLFASWYLGEKIRHGIPVRMFSRKTWHGLGVAALFAAFIIAQPDMATMCIVFGLMWLLYVVAGMPKGEILLTFGAIAA